MTRFCTLDERHERMLLVLNGEIDLVVAEPLRHVLHLAIVRAAVACGDCDVDVDLRAVTLLDCAAIGVLIGARRTAHRVGRNLFVSHPTAMVRRVLESTGDLRSLTNPHLPPARTAPSSVDAGRRLVAHAGPLVPQQPHEPYPTHPFPHRP